MGSRSRSRHGARRSFHREHALGTECRRLAGVVVEHRVDAGDRSGEELPVLVDTLAKPRDCELPDDLGDAAVLDVGDEQPRLTCAAVDRRDAHGRYRSKVL